MRLRLLAIAYAAFLSGCFGWGPQTDVTESTEAVGAFKVVTRHSTTWPGKYNPSQIYGLGPSFSTEYRIICRSGLKVRDIGSYAFNLRATRCALATGDLLKPKSLLILGEWGILAKRLPPDWICQDPGLSLLADAQDQPKTTPGDWCRTRPRIEWRGENEVWFIYEKGNWVEEPSPYSTADGYGGPAIMLREVVVETKPFVWKFREGEGVSEPEKR